MYWLARALDRDVEESAKGSAHDPEQAVMKICVAQGTWAVHLALSTDNASNVSLEGLRVIVS